jgi:hypothetical protein
MPESRSDMTSRALPSWRPISRVVASGFHYRRKRVRSIWNLMPFCVVMRAFSSLHSIKECMRYVERYETVGTVYLTTFTSVSHRKSLERGNRLTEQERKEKSVARQHWQWEVTQPHSSARPCDAQALAMYNQTFSFGTGSSSPSFEAAPVLGNKTSSMHRPDYSSVTSETLRPMSETILWFFFNILFLFPFYLSKCIEQRTCKKSLLCLNVGL